MLTLPACEIHLYGTQMNTSHSRHNIDDVIDHPPFHHNVRRHLRHMVSRKAAAAAAAAEKRKEEAADGKPIRKISFEVLDNHTSPVTEETRYMDSHGSSDSDSDAGITFTVDTPNDRGKHQVTPPPSTAAESSLPWKRAYIQPALPSFTRTENQLETAAISECPSWAASFDYIADSPHAGSVVDEQEKVDDAGVFSIPPPWRTSPSSDELRTEDDSTLPESQTDVVDGDADHSESQLNGAIEKEVAKADENEPSLTADKPTSLDLHDNAKQNGKTLGDVPLPWRSPSVTNEVEPMISPSASQVWSHGPMGAIVENGESHHSDPISGHHHVTTSIYDELQDYHSLLPTNNTTFHSVLHTDPDVADLDEDEALAKLQFHRRHPSFIRTKSHQMLQRRPSITLPVELNHEEDCRDRIRKWLQSSHPDSLACPPDFVLDMSSNHAPPVDETAV